MRPSPRSCEEHPLENAPERAQTPHCHLPRTRRSGARPNIAVEFRTDEKKHQRDFPPAGDFTTPSAESALWRCTVRPGARARACGYADATSARRVSPQHQTEHRKIRVWTPEMTNAARSVRRLLLVSARTEPQPRSVPAPFSASTAGIHCPFSFCCC